MVGDEIGGVRDEESLKRPLTSIEEDGEGPDGSVVG